MARKKLTIAQQLEVIKEAKELYVNGYYSINCRFLGMCILFQYALKKLYRVNARLSSIHYYIPLFSYNNMVAFGKKGVIPEPYNYSSPYWWSIPDRTIRPKVFDYLVKELEKQV